MGKAMGLYNKYIVRRVDDGEKNPKSKHYGGCTLFVLDINHDPHALPALEAYIKSCEKQHPTLAGDLQAKVDAVAGSLDFRTKQTAKKKAAKK